VLPAEPVEIMTRRGRGKGRKMSGRKGRELKKINRE